jgi:nucleotidyltransferase/DNA polymerase involved in DNA repair
MGVRLACLFVPLFPLAARLRSEPDLKAEAVAILDGNGGAACILAATRPARRLGIRVGMTLAQARALIPGLIARGRDPVCERAASEALFEVALSFSPRVEETGHGVVYLDLTGIAGSRRLLKDGRTGQSPERSLALSLLAVSERAGLPARVGIAGSKLSARMAAQLSGSPTVVPQGDEAAFLAPLPIGKLVGVGPEETGGRTPNEKSAAGDRKPGIGRSDMSPEQIGDWLLHWGIRTVGDFARLPKRDLVDRLGRAGEELHRKACGIDPRPLVPRPPPPELREGMDLEWPLVSLEPFLFVARAALDRLTARLDSQGLACRRLEIALRLEPDGHDTRAIDLPAPTRDVKTLLALARLNLEKRPPEGPVSGFTFAATPDRPRRTQISLFGPAAVSPDRLATMRARLDAMLGPGRAVSPMAVDGHRPERFGEKPYDPPPPPVWSEDRGPVCGPQPGEEKPAGRKRRSFLAVRVLRPPVEVEVVVEEERRQSTVDSSQSLDSRRPQMKAENSHASSLCPVHLTSIRTEVPEPHAPAIAGRVRVASGPWKMEEGWWRQDISDRHYWDVELEGGRLFRIFRDARSGRWFADGVYD